MSATTLTVRHGDRTRGKREFVVRREHGLAVCERCSIADNPWTRLRGLLGRRELESGEGLLCTTAAIHTFFMRFPIDAVFVDRNGAAVDIRADLRPWRAAVCRGAHAVLELAAGEANRRRILPGDRLVT